MPTDDGRDKGLEGIDLDSLVRASIEDEDQEFSRPSDQQITAYLTGTATPEEKAEVTAALSLSARFRDEVIEIARDIHRLPGMEDQRKPREEGLLRFFRPVTRLVPAPALAAGLVALLLIIPAYRGWKLEQAMKAAAGSAGGQIEVIVLDASRNDAVQVRFSREQRFVYIAIPLEVPESVAGSQLYRLELIGPSGQEAWSTEVPAGKIREAHESDIGEATFGVPTGVFAAGAHEFRFISPAGEVTIIPFSAIPED